MTSSPTCAACRAYDGQRRCELGFPVSPVKTAHGTATRAPLGPCPRPLTVKALLAAMAQRKAEANGGGYKKTAEV